MPKLLTLSKSLVSFVVFINTFCSAYANMQLCFVMIDNCKMLTVFQVKFKEINQSYSPSRVNQSISIK